ncbi:AAA family ATPase [Paractinoplanes rishiriensis]|uniref:ATPase n=1 Tax=Paractinoplanes rishiriensis TaxID=1050105 RepID=A0A919MZW7_9ACTN|nr:ATP-binding protein [Actinoplanes rishiriensis]GIE98855.1 ATPase [Actinoplanes rishiriensis]
MDERTAQFVETFRAFLNEVVAEHRGAPPDDESALLPPVREHLGVDPRRVPVVSEDVPAYRFVDLDIALGEIERRGDRHDLVGIGGGEQRRHHSLSEILENAGRFGQFPLGPVDYTSVATGPDDTREVVAFGLRLFRFGGAPVAVLQRAADPRYGSAAARMEVLAAAPGTAAALIDAVHAQMLASSVLRRQVLTLGGSDFEPGVGGITFHRRPALTPDDIILPAGVLDRLHRHVAGVARHRDRLRAAGQHLKRGLLLYGPPGTGKTHTVRYLLGALPELTVILLAGPSIQYVSEAARMARALQPALVVLEDCDLVAEDRGHHPGAQPLLFEVLEALDGLADDADVAFLLTTNRVDVLEPALAQRPGRVDLAVEVPLPDQAARRLLLARYARGLPFSSAALDDAAARADGVTASFVKELVRRCVLIAAEDDRDPADDDLAQALREMLGEAQNVTRSLLGSLQVTS